MYPILTYMTSDSYDRKFRSKNTFLVPMPRIVQRIFLLLIVISSETSKVHQDSKSHNDSDLHALFKSCYPFLFHLRIRRSLVNLLSTRGLPLFTIMLSSILTPNLFSIYIPGSTVTAIFALSSSSLFILSQGGS